LTNNQVKKKEEKQGKTLLEKESKPPTESEYLNIDEVYEAISYVGKFDSEEDIKDMETN
jgi:hypothetical protein